MLTAPSIPTLEENDMSGGGGGFVYTEPGFTNAVRRTMHTGFAQLRRLFASR